MQLSSSPLGPLAKEGSSLGTDESAACKTDEPPQAPGSDDLQNGPMAWASADMYGSRKELSAGAGVPYAEGEMEDEFCISYGEKGNRALMEQYGFVVPANPFDGLEDWLQPAASGWSICFLSGHVFLVGSLLETF